MERKLFQAFDRQRFQQNARLASIIGDVESRYARALKDDDLEMVGAAGEATVRTMNPDMLPGRCDIPAAAKENKP